MARNVGRGLLWAASVPVAMVILALGAVHTPLLVVVAIVGGAMVAVFVVTSEE